jgi:hypothetical protein
MSKKLLTELNAKVTKPFWHITKPYSHNVREEVTFKWAILPYGPSWLAENNKKFIQFKFLSCFKPPFCNTATSWHYSTVPLAPISFHFFSLLYTPKKKLCTEKLCTAKVSSCSSLFIFKHVSSSILKIVS